jgi:hypothetical protein
VPQVGCGLGIDGTAVGRGVGTNVAIEQTRSRSFWSGGGQVGTGTAVDRGSRVGIGVTVAITTTCGADGVVVVVVGVIDVAGRKSVDDIPDAARYSGYPSNGVIAKSKRANAVTSIAVDSIALMKVGVPWWRSRGAGTSEGIIHCLISGGDRHSLTYH